MSLKNQIVGREVIGVESAMGRIALHLDNSDVVAFTVEYGFEEFSEHIVWERWTAEAWADYKKLPGRPSPKPKPVKMVELADVFDRMEAKKDE